MTLIDRLSKLEGPDWTISCEIISSLISVDDPDAKDFYGSGKDYTASVDAALALAERMLPGHRWSAGFSRHVPHNAQIWVPSGSGYYEGESDANRAIALCIAILRAKDASHDTH